MSDHKKKSHSKEKVTKALSEKSTTSSKKKDTHTTKKTTDKAHKSKSKSPDGIIYNNLALHILTFSKNIVQKVQNIDLDHMKKHIPYQLKKDNQGKIN